MRQKLFLMDVDHYEEGGRSVVRLWCKDQKGHTVAVVDDAFVPYLYVLPKSGIEEKVKSDIERLFSRQDEVKPIKIDIVERKIGAEKRKMIRIFTAIPTDLQKARHVVKYQEAARGGPGTIIEEFEYSTSHSKRYLIERGLVPMDWIEVDGEAIETDWQVQSAIRASSVKAVHSDVCPKLKALAFDIENIEERGKQKIIMLSLAGPGFKKVLTWQHDHFQKWVEVVKNEKTLIERFVAIVNEQDPDILLGFMSDEHDFQIIHQRAEELNIKLSLNRDGSAVSFARRTSAARQNRRPGVPRARLKGRMHIDLFSWILDILAPQLQTEVMTLDAISAELLNDRKIPMEFEEMIESWRKKKNLAKLAEYSFKDSQLVLRLSELILPQIWGMTSLIGQTPSEVSRMTYGQLVEWYLTKCAFEMGYVSPNQPRFDEIMERLRRKRYVGGYVHEPMPGLHEGIAVLDFRSMYPSIIATFNISPETLNLGKKGEGIEVPERPFWFAKQPTGFVSTVIRKLIERRTELKKELKRHRPGTAEWNRANNEQFAAKTVGNAAYGLMGFAGAKWYCSECAESAAAFGRYYIKKVIDTAGKSGFHVVYADTDSMFIKLAKSGKLEKSVEKFLEQTNKILPGLLELDLQGFYKRGIFASLEKGGAAKKRYALIDQKGKLTIRGFERVRADWCELARYTQEEVIRLVLDKKDVKGAIRAVKSAVAQVKKGRVNLRELAIYEQLSKPLHEYKTIGPHVAVARKMVERGRPVGEGMTMIYVITKGKQSISQRAEPIEDVKLKDVDNEYYIAKQIIPPSLRVLAALGVTREQLE